MMYLRYMLYINVTLQDVTQLLRLWYHECCRVFQDRLVNNEDRSWFENLLQSKISEFGIETNDVLSNDCLLYGDFMNPNADPRIYEEITDILKVL